MKKFLAIALGLVMALSLLAGCTGKKEAVKAKVISIALTEGEYAFGVDKTQPELLEKVNAFIDKTMKDGTFDAVCNNYFGDGTPVAVQSAKEDASKDQLIVATNAAFEPFEYMDGDSYYGIDMEIAALLAKELGKELVIANMDFDAVCLSVGQQKADIAMAGLTVKEDRKEFVDFSKTYYEANQLLIVPSTNTKFDAFKTDAEIVDALKADTKATIGVQNGTTGQFFAEGDEDWGFDGLGLTVKGYKNGSLAVQDMLNGNIQYVIIDSAPAKCITEKLNSMTK